jgi:2-methylcitrate dehydratase
MTQRDQLAEFIARASFEELSPNARQQLRIRILDSIGCAIGALDGEPIRIARAQVDELGGKPQCTLIGGGTTSLDRAAFYNTALVRYLDFMDNFLAKGETCHPSDNLAAVLCAGEFANRTGKDFMTALAVAYQVQIRLTESAPIMRSGFDHTSQHAFSVAAGVSKALGLSAERTANALSIGGVNSISLAIIRAVPISQWKGLASANTAFHAAHCALLAARGITGPEGIFEGTQGFMQALGEKFHIDWSRETLDAVPRTAVKKFNAEVHAQSALEATLDLRGAHRIRGEDVSKVEVEIFRIAYDIVGGGEFGKKNIVRSKEDADHNLPYMIAVALLDGEVWPPQFTTERINRPDVQRLLCNVTVSPKRTYTWHYPEQMRCRVAITMADGQQHECDKTDFEGFPTRPITWQRAQEKFNRLTTPFTTDKLRDEIIAAVESLENIEVKDLMQLLSQAAPRPM